MVGHVIVCHGLGRAPEPLLSRRLRVGICGRDSRAEEALTRGRNRVCRGLASDLSSSLPFP